MGSGVLCPKPTRHAWSAIQQDLREEGSLIRSRHKSYLQTFRLRDIGLTLVGSQENLAFEQQGTCDVNEIYSPSSGFLRLRRRQFARSIHCRIHVQSDLSEGASFQELMDTGQSRVSLAYDLCALAGRSNAPFMKGAMEDRVFNLQLVWDFRLQALSGIKVT